ncbi:MAG: DUF3810 family protein, partial [Candidatus Eremiobacteraeota bacterium]|nr:DUF3810 family protein [Candidatus Eremiobacteraeota bacterium]
FVWFALSWAYNYDRVQVADKIPLHPERTNAGAVLALANGTIDALSRDVAAAHRERPSDDEIARRLYPHFLAVIHRLGEDADVSPPRVKLTMFQPLFEATATNGFTDPWTHEVNLDATAFWYERPAIYAHEWAHIAGFADETEANFIAVLTCATSGDPLLRYSGSLLTWFNLPSSVRATHKINRQAYNDINAVRTRVLKHIQPTVERASRAAYDQYLKANRVEAGFASYGLFIRWLTAADFDRDGLPLVKNGVSRSTTEPVAR